MDYRSKKPAPILNSIETQNRFNELFIEFLKCIAKPEHPFVLFLDDLQWADLASLSLLRTTLNEVKNSCLLIVGAYRDNEVDENHPLSSLIDEIVYTGIPHSIIKVDNLDKKDIALLIRDALNTGENINTLLDYICDRTYGNPFFTIELLKSFVDERIIEYNYESNRWIWDEECLKQQSFTDNVVDLMTSKLKKLEENKKQVLQIAACLGNKFSYEHLALVYGDSPEILQKRIQEIIKERYFISIRQLTNNDIFYKFSHDRIQQAAYTLFSKRKKENSLKYWKNISKTLCE